MSGRPDDTGKGIDSLKPARFDPLRGSSNFLPTDRPPFPAGRASLPAASHGPATGPIRGCASGRRDRRRWRAAIGCGAPSDDAKAGYRASFDRHELRHGEKPYQTRPAATTGVARSRRFCWGFRWKRLSALQGYGVRTFGPTPESSEYMLMRSSHQRFQVLLTGRARGVGAPPSHTRAGQGGLAGERVEWGE